MSKIGDTMLSLHPDDIEVGERHRAVDVDTVDRIAHSLDEIGLRQPITVRIVEEMEIDGQRLDGVPVLVAGAHRLAAAKQLGWDAIDCIEIEGDEIAAELWEIAENLHRLDLTKDQRDRQIRRYAVLLEKRKVQSRQVAAFESRRKDGRGHRPKGIPRRIAEQTGLSVDTVRRALNVKAALPKPSEAKRIARETGRLVAASDGHTYSGADDAEADAYAAKRNRAFRIIDAINTLADASRDGDTTANWEKHWLHGFNSAQLGQAREWLASFERELEARP